MGEKVKTQVCHFCHRPIDVAWVFEANVGPDRNHVGRMFGACMFCVTTKRRHEFQDLATLSSRRLDGSVVRYRRVFAGQAHGFRIQDLENQGPAGALIRIITAVDKAEVTMPDSRVVIGYSFCVAPDPYDRWIGRLNAERRARRLARFHANDSIPWSTSLVAIPELCRGPLLEAVLAAEHPDPSVLAEIDDTIRALSKTFPRLWTSDLAAYWKFAEDPRRHRAGDISPLPKPYAKLKDMMDATRVKLHAELEPGAFNRAAGIAEPVTCNVAVSHPVEFSS